ncbi:MAG: 2-amino-4-hydroxy-6-hydroxymethyldihydropteridine diphosphokinase, partial [Thermomicrobium sp.]
MVTAYIGLGSNLGDRWSTLRIAVWQLRTLGRVRAVSSLYETEPVGYRDQPWFLNAVAILETALESKELLHRLLEIERAAGRRRSFPNAPRTLDLDLLLYDAVVLA